MSIPEKSGKTRTIALGDCFTQTALYPVHNYFMKILEKIPSDCTFDQELGHAFMLEKTSKKCLMTCFDLKDCTDRFPIMFQEKVVRHYLGSEIAES